jgi:hypothetical protein
MMPIKNIKLPQPHMNVYTCLVYNKTVPDDDFIKLKHVVIETQVFLLVVLTDKIKSIYLYYRLLLFMPIWRHYVSELRPPTGLVFVSQTIYEHGATVE